MKFTPILAGLCVMCFFCGCTGEPGGEKTPATTEKAVTTSSIRDATTLPAQAVSFASSTVPAQKTSSTKASPTTTTKPAPVPATNLAINRTCSSDAECASGCCYPSGEKKKCADAPACRIRDLSEDGCYKEGLYWCIDRCQKDACGGCSKRVRCVSFEDNGTTGIKVETAEEVKGHAGSCRYSGSYENADDTDGYCDRNEGNLIRAKCGSSPSADDCLRLYDPNVLYMIGKKRSFHSPEGESYDLWCFRCDAAV